jgi:hypothetical protein
VSDAGSTDATTAEATHDDAFAVGVPIAAPAPTPQASRCSHLGPDVPDETSRWGDRSMLPSHYHLARVLEEDRHRGEARRHEHERALREPRVERPTLPARLIAGAARYVRRDGPSLAGLACRLPDGKIGRTVFVQQGGEWALVCRVG